YPVEATAAQDGLNAQELIENIDIGGPALVRSAAKNFESVAVVVDPADYPHVARELEAARELSLATRLDLARRAFSATTRYDGLIATELERLTAADGGGRWRERPALPERLHLALARKQSLRYGENPQQHAAIYVSAGRSAEGLAGARQLQGKELSYNNLVDLDAAWALAQEFTLPAAVIVKHSNPCGAAEQKTLLEAYRKAYACDPVSAYGGIVAVNRPMDAATAKEVSKLFVDCIVAPGDEETAGGWLSATKNLRLMEMPAGAPSAFVPGEAAREQEAMAGSVVASDAFCPFPDGVEESARAGATAVIQPGESMRDAEVIAVANKLGLAMVFTGVRHFRH